MNDKYKYSENPTFCNEVIFNDEHIKVTKKWCWNVKSVHEKPDINVLKVLLDGESFNCEGKSTFVSYEGKRLTDLEFDYLGDWENEMCCIGINGKGYGFLNKNIEVIIPPKYKYANDFNNDYAPVYNGKEWLYVDKNGNELYLENQYQRLENFSEGLARVSLLNISWEYLAYHSEYPEFAGYWGYVDKNGKEVIKPQYIYAFDFIGDRAIVAKGKWTIDKKWDNEYNQGKYWTEEELWGVIDKQGNEIIPCIYDEIKRFVNNDWNECKDYFAVHVGGWRNGKWAVIDRNGRFATEPVFEDIYYDYYNGLFTYREKDTMEDIPLGIYDLNQNKILFEPMFDDVIFLEDGNIIVEIFDENLGYTVEKIIDKTGKEIFKSNYTRINTFKYPYETKIDRNGKKIFGLINKNGTILANCEANDIASINYIEEVDFNEKRYLFKQNEKIGVKSIDGNIIIPAIYDKIFLKNDNLYTVCIDKNIENSCGLCKKDGTIILEPKYYNIQVCNNRTIICNKKPGVEVFEYEIVR